MTKVETEEQLLINAYKEEKDAKVVRRIQLVMLVQIDKKSASKAAVDLHMSRGWGPKWYKRYRNEGIDGLRSRPKSGRPPRVARGIMKRVRRVAQKIQKCWTAEEMIKVHTQYDRLRV